FEKIESKTSVSKLYEDKIDLLTELDRPDDALELIEKAIKIYEEIDDIDTNADIIAIFGNKVHILIKLDRQDDALDTIEKAIKICEEIDDIDTEDDIITFYHDKARILIKLDRRDDALDATEKAIKIYEEIDDIDTNANTNVKLMTNIHYLRYLILTEHRRYKEALEDINRVIELQELMENQSYIASLYFYKGNTLLDLNNPEEAEKAFNRVEEINNNKNLSDTPQIQNPNQEIPQVPQ